MNITSTNNRKVDMEKMMIILSMAFMGGFGFLMLLGGVLHIEVLRFSPLTIMGLTIGMSGVFFGILLLTQMKE